jgi:radical SAM protein with 4Fe4S-binding SPASM domain
MSLRQRLDQDMTDAERRIANTVIMGRIAELDTIRAKARVTTGDITTGWLPFATARAGQDRTWHAPESHCLGKVSALAPGASGPVPPAVRMSGKQRTKCSRCLVLSVCRGGCPYSPEAYEEYNCAAAYHQYLPIIGMALHHLTGKLLTEVKPWSTHKGNSHA